MKLLLIIPFCFAISFVNAQEPVKKNSKTVSVSYAGKYESQGMIVQVILKNKSLVLLVPGAPLQQMIPAGTDKFKTDAFSDEIFIFRRSNGSITAMTSRRQGQSLEFKKVSNIPDDADKVDSLLVLHKSSLHFYFLYNNADSNLIDGMINELERNYKRILKDLKPGKMPVITVRIYPDLNSFQQGINFPNAPAEVQATAFGKNDFRIVSPRQSSLDSIMFMKGVVHEFTHCVHLNMDYAPNNPRWLWEGLAMFESGFFFDPKDIDEIKNRKFPTLAGLNNGLEYMLGYVVIEAIKDIWGFNTVISLIKKRGNAQAVLHITEGQFEERIFTHIYEKYITNERATSQ